MPKINPEERLAKALEQMRADDRANVDAPVRVPTGVGFTGGSNSVAPKTPAKSSSASVKSTSAKSSTKTSTKTSNKTSNKTVKKPNTSSGNKSSANSDPSATANAFLRLSGALQSTRDTIDDINRGKDSGSLADRGAEILQSSNKGWQPSGWQDNVSDFLEAIPASVQRGADSAYTGFTGFLDFVAGQPLEALGWKDNPISRWNENAQAEAAANAAYWDDRIDNRAAKLMADVGSQVVAALPDAVLAFATGGTSAAASGTTKALQAASRAGQATRAAGAAGTAARLADSVVDAARAAAPATREMLSNRQYWLSFAQTAGNSFNAARAEGVDSAKATAYAAVNGLLGAIVEIGGGGIQSLPSELKQSPSQLKVWLDGLIDEGQEEIVQGVIDRLAQNVTYQAGNPIVSLSDENAVFNPITAAKEGAMGAAVGGIVGGGQILANNAINSIAQRRAQRDLDAFLEAAGIDTQAQPEAVVAPESAPIQEQAQTAAPESQPVQEVVQESPVAPESAPVQESLVEHTPVAVEAQTGDGAASVVEQLRAAIPQLQNTAPVANVTGNEIPQGGKLVDRLVRFAESIGNKVVRPGFGEVLFSKSRIKNSMLGHGVGPAKIETFAAVPDVVRDGAQIAYAENWKGRPYNTYIFAAPINYRGELTYVAAVVTKDANSGKYYLHEVLSEDGSLVSESKNQQDTTSDGNATQTGAFYTVSSPADNNIIADANQNINPESSVGAAPAGFVDPESARLTEEYQNAVDTYGALPERPNLARQMEVPASMDGETVTPRTVQTALGSEATSSEAVGAITDEVARGNFSRAVITDRASLARAEETIRYKSWDNALRDWTADVREGKVSKDLATLGLTLYNNAIANGDAETGIHILTDLVDHARAGAQATQAMNILNKLTPEGKLYSIQRSIQNIRDAAIKRTGKAIPEITIDPELAQTYVNAQTQEEADAALDALYNNIAAQVPVTWYDRLNAWRYFAMLANPRTHIRNIVGNAGFAPVRGVKNIVGAGLEGVFIRDRNNRTKAVSSRLLSAEDRARYRAAQSEFGQVVDLIQGGGKFNDERNAILSRRNMFIQPLEGLRRANEWALDHEDILFSKQAYSASLMQYLRAHKITAEQYLSEGFDRSAAQAYAIKEAQKATYRDANAFSDLVSKLHTRGNTAFEKGVDTLIGGILPFKRTPANILVRGMEYSPAGLLKGLGDAVFNVSRGRMTAAEAIDEIAAGLTGTGLMALGVLLSRMGLVTGGSTGDEEQDNFNSLRGMQNYAMTIGDRNFTLDWLAPEALPFFVGVELNKALDSEGAITDDIWGALNSITDPLLEMSMLSGVTDMLDSVAYADGNSIWPVLASSVTGYISQYIPTLLGQIERTMEDTRQTTYTDSESWIPSDVQYAISRAANRIPGKVEYQTREYIDAWGRPVSTGETWQERAINNFLNPSYMSTDRSTSVDDELQRLYDSLGGAGSEYSVFPKRVTQGTNVAGEPLGNNEFVEYATELGQTSLKAVEDLLATSEYQRMTDKERADAVDMMYDYAKVVAANSIGRIYDSGYSRQYDAIDAERKVDIDPVEYMLIADTLSGFTSDKDEEGKTISGSKKEKVVDYIAGLDMNPAQKNYLYLAQNYAESGLADMEWNQ